MKVNIKIDFSFYGRGLQEEFIDMFENDMEEFDEVKDLYEIVKNRYKLKADDYIPISVRILEIMDSLYSVDEKLFEYMQRKHIINSNCFLSSSDKEKVNDPAINLIQQIIKKFNHNYKINEIYWPDNSGTVILMLEFYNEEI